MIKGLDYIGVGVGAVILNDSNKLFLSLRGENVRNEKGLWEFPGGGLKFMEEFEIAIKREIMEDYDFEIEILDFLDLCNHIIPEEKQHWVAPTYICKFSSGIPKIMEPDKCEKIGWFSISEIQNLPLTIISKHNLTSLMKYQTKP